MSTKHVEVLLLEMISTEGSGRTVAIEVALTRAARTNPGKDDALTDATISRMIWSFQAEM